MEEKVKAKRRKRKNRECTQAEKKLGRSEEARSVEFFVGHWRQGENFIYESTSVRATLSLEASEATEH